MAIDARSIFEMLEERYERVCTSSQTRLHYADFTLSRVHVGMRGSHEPKRPTSHDALSSMAAARLSHSAAGDGVDTRSLFERSKEQAAETAYDMRKSILPVLPESDHEDLVTEGSSRGGTEKSDSEVSAAMPPSAMPLAHPQNTRDLFGNHRVTAPALLPPLSHPTALYHPSTLPFPLPVSRA